MSKPGKYGTLYLFTVSYNDPTDPAFGTQTYQTWAYNAEHVSDKFYENEFNSGWDIVAIKKTK